MKTGDIPDGNTVADLQRHGWVVFSYDLRRAAWVGFDRDSTEYAVTSKEFEAIPWALGYCEGFQYRFSKPAHLKAAGVSRIPRRPVHVARA